MFDSNACAQLQDAVFDLYRTGLFSRSECSCLWFLVSGDPLVETLWQDTDDKEAGRRASVIRNDYRY
jgi:hypothetical protein